MSDMPKGAGLILMALWSLVFASSAQFLIVTPLLPEIRDQFGVAEGWLGLLITLYAVGVGVFSLIAGPVSDRFGRRIVLVVGSIGMTIALNIGYDNFEKLLDG
ncbi:MAG: MFS transporter, partial [Myxococcota bacterium]